MYVRFVATVFLGVGLIVNRFVGLLQILFLIVGVRLIGKLTWFRLELSGLKPLELLAD